ncbi:PDZ domain-containing protein [Candidatus Uhrbacteria bacterium]|nr:PDZ domain-containing protein [Candidatus Uhrbacteria bacterium]
MEKGSHLLRPEWVRERRGRGIREVPSEVAEWMKGDVFKLYRDAIEVTKVMEGSAGGQAGLSSGDIILSLDGEPANMFTFSEKLQSPDGSEKTFEIQVRGRDGVERKALLTPHWNKELTRSVIGIIMEVHHDLIDWESLEQEGSSQRIGFTLEYALEKTVRGYAEVGAKDQEKEHCSLKKYVLIYESPEGRLMEVDILERFNLTEAECFIDPTLPSSGVCYWNNNQVSIKSLVTQITPHILAHEFRHAQQGVKEHGDRTDDGDDPIGEILRQNLYIPSTTRNYDQKAFWDKRLKRGGIQILKTCLRVGGVVKTDEEAGCALGSVSEAFARLQDAQEKFAQLREIQFSRNSIEADAHRRTSLLAAQEELTNAREHIPDSTTEISKGVTLMDILRLPTLMIERDAEYGALTALRELKRETGIDLLEANPKQAVLIPTASTTNTVEFTSSVIGGFDSFQSIASNLGQIGVDIPCVRRLRASVNQDRAVNEVKNTEHSEEDEEVTASA